MKILIVKLSSIGDVVHTLPALHAIRRALPRAEISWAVERSAAEILRGNPLINRLIELDTRSVRRGERKTGSVWRDARRQMRELRREEFDIALDFQGLLKSASIIRLAKAAKRFGFSKENLREPASRFLLNETVAAVAPQTHIVRKNLALAAEALNITVPADDFEFPIQTDDRHRREAAHIIEAAGENFVVLNPAGGWTTKLWAAERFGALADRFWAENRLASVVTTAPNEIELAERVLRSNRSGKVFLAQPSLKGFYELARKTRLYVGGDTAPTHLAVAARAPTVGIFGPTEWWRNGSPHENDICVERLDIGCRADCHRRQCSNWVCLDIETETVWQAAQKRLKLSAQ